VSLLGVILAGGESRRMGTDKALVDVAGVPMVLRVASALAVVADELIVVGRSGELLGLPCIPDDGPPHRGPLAGIALALRLAGEGMVAAIGVDQPWVRAETLVGLAGLAEKGQALVLIDHDVPQVTCAVYPAGAARSADLILDRGGAARDLLDEIAWRPVTERVWSSWGEDGRSWFSVDSFEALDEGLTRFGHP
jgi:molybdopterin-guanine dinucleotide biosynthesis protein A